MAITVDSRKQRARHSFYLFLLSSVSGVQGGLSYVDRLVGIEANAPEERARRNRHCGEYWDNMLFAQSFQSVIDWTVILGTLDADLITISDLMEEFPRGPRGC